MIARTGCTECGETSCGCERWARARLRDEERFEPRLSDVSWSSQSLVKTEAEAERALRGVIDSTREERIDALRAGPQMRRTLAMHIVIKRCEALALRESVIERREAA